MSVEQNSLGFLLADVYRFMRRAFAEKLAGDSALTMAQARALLFVSRREGLRQVELADLLEVKRKTQLPVYLGSGVTTANLKQFFAAADGFIIGSEFKAGGHWSKAVDPGRVAGFMKAHDRLCVRS